jgi:hypothetical protein
VQDERRTLDDPPSLPVGGERGQGEVQERRRTLPGFWLVLPAKSVGPEPFASTPSGLSTSVASRSAGTEIVCAETGNPASSAASATHPADLMDTRSPTR